MHAVLIATVVLIALGDGVGAQAPSCSTTLPPGANVASALSAAAPGETICLSAGSYDALETSETTQRVTVRPAHGAAATVAGVVLTSASGITLQGLEITPDGVRIRGSRNIKLLGNHIHDIRRLASCPTGWDDGTGYGVQIGLWNDVRSARITVRRNLIERIPHDAIHLGAVDDALVEANEVRHVVPQRCDDHADSMQWVDGTRVTIRRNHFHDSTHGFMVDGHHGTFRGAGRFENNLMHDIAGIGFNLYNVEGLALVNNTVWDTGNLAARLRDEGNPTVMLATVRNNLFEKYSNECGRCVTDAGGNVVGGNPRFGPGYELRRRSPAVNTGTTVDAPVVDRLGRRRDGRPDAGAHELIQDGTTPEGKAPPSRGRAGGRVLIRAHQLIGRGARGTANRLTARRRGRAWRVTDAAKGLRAGPGCLRVTVETVRCHAAGVRRVVLIGGARDDRLIVVGGGRTVLVGGSGDDRLVARSRRAVLRGGPGNDRLTGPRTARLVGGPGADRLVRR